jgi:ribonuclease HI
MPRGYYLAQGLIPLGYSSSDDEEGPCELPNGRIVCGPHGLVVCDKCCTDYSAMDVDSDDDDDEDSDVEEDDDEESDEPPEDLLRYLGNEMVRGTGQVFPSKFVPSNSNTAPLQEFSNRHRHIGIFR